MANSVPRPRLAVRGGPIRLPRHRPLRVLITRLSHIGDCILAIPILEALRARFPDARIDWIVERPSNLLLEGHAALDELIVLSRGWLKSPRRVWSLRRELRQRRFDVTIDPQSLSKSSILGWLSGARWRIGLAAPDGRELAPWLNNCLVRRSREHVVDLGLELLQPLGIHSPEVRFEIPVAGSARHSIDDQIRREKLEGGFVAINPGAGWDSRLWPTERYGAVAAHLGRVHGTASLVAWAGDREREWALQIVAASSGHARLAPPTSLQELAALLARARFYLGSDTGPLHLAVAVGTRSISLHGPTQAAKSGPYGPGHRSVQEVYHDGSSRERRKADNASMKAISVQRVCRECDELLAELRGADGRREVA